MPQSLGRRAILEPAVHWHQHRAGQSLVELAIVLPLLALLVFGGIDAVQILMTNYTVERAVRAAAHQAALDGGASPAVSTVAELILDNGIGMRAPHGQLTVDCAAPCTRYSAVTVTISYTGRVWVPIAIWNTFTARATTVRASETDRSTQPSAAPASCGILGAPPCP